MDAVVVLAVVDAKITVKMQVEIDSFPCGKHILGDLRLADCLNIVTSSASSPTSTPPEEDIVCAEGHRCLGWNRWIEIQHALTSSFP